MPCAPDAGSRVNATPVPESIPTLPNTMLQTLTAVPRSEGIRSCRRYSTARSVFHESKTARTAMSSCSRGSCGKSWPVWSLISCLYVATSSRRSSTVRSRSFFVARSSFRSSSASWKAIASMPSTVEPNIASSRR